MQPTTLTAQPDVQASAPTVHVSLSRVGITGVEKVIRIAAGRRPSAALLREPRMLRRSRPEAEGRAHVALRGGRQRRHRRGDPQRDRLQGRAARRAHRPARPRAPGRAARRGHDRRALSGVQARARVRHPHAGDLHALRLGRGERERHAPARRRRRAGHDRMPVRAADRRRPRARAPHERRLLRRPRSSASSTPSRSRRTTSAASGRCTSAAPRAARTRSRRRRCSRSSRTRCRARSTSS